MQPTRADTATAWLDWILAQPTSEKPAVQDGAA
jgi:hypothetical protein